LVEQRLGRGGMGAVYRVLDQSTGRRVALKRLGRDGDLRKRTRMFEREYHTLAGLRHPRIIEVYDYGRDAEGPFYTMELLDGRDLRELAPLPYRQACRYLRDVAASLALLHARRLLHRDLSPRNVRITSDDRAKLLDFGALAGFGRTATVVGTPPGVPPESLYGADLDQRADLYSLGALSYWLLTGKHAFDVRALDELPEAWSRQPPPPSALVRANGQAAIPPALDELVMSLLQKNPLARPSSAGEVLARLSTLAELPPEDEPLSAQSYLRGGKTVGRARERAQLRKRLRRALTGSGSLTLIEAEAGMGVGRILGELAVEARLSGATAVVLDARQHGGVYGVASELVRALLRALPEQTQAALSQSKSDLARLLSESSGHVSTLRFGALTARGQGDPREQRLRVQSALLQVLSSVCEAAPLMLAVHNFQRADDSSAAFLQALAQLANERRLCLLLAHNPDESASAQSVLESLTAHFSSLRLRGLTRDEVRALCESIFGEAQNVERLASWLHELCSGNPQHCLEVLEHLVEQQTIHFADGVWSLPIELSRGELPEDLSQMVQARIGRASEPAQRLCAAVAVHHGPLELDACLELGQSLGIDDAMAALSELEQRGILVTHESTVAFAHVTVREAALRRLPDQERRRLHRLLGGQLAKTDSSEPEAMLDAGWHLLHGGQERRGADLLAEAGRALATDAEGMRQAIPALEAALGVYKQQGRSLPQCAPVLVALAVCGFYVDRKTLDVHGEQALTGMQQRTGMSLAARLRPILGGPLSTMVGMGMGFLRAVLRSGFRRAVRVYRNDVMDLSRVAMLVMSAATITLDGTRARAVVDKLAPLAHLPGAGAFSYGFAKVLSQLPEDRVAQTLAALGQIRKRLLDPTDLLDLRASDRQLMLAGAIYASGSLECFRESPDALLLASELDQMGPRLFQMFGDQIRATYHGLRGELAQSQHYRERVELFAMQAGSSWQAEVWAPATEVLVSLVTGDFIAVRRAAEQLERLGRELPSLRVHQQLATACYHLVRGDTEASFRIGRMPLDAHEPRGFIGWTSAVAGHVRNLAALGQAEQARMLGLRTFALLDAADREVSAMVAPLVIELALVEAALGDATGATARLESFLAELGTRGGPATRGNLHEALARIALQAKDLPRARLELSHMDRWLRPTENPALIARCERLHRELDTGDRTSRAALQTLDLGLPEIDQLRDLLRGYKNRQERFERALEVLLEHTGAASGHMFAVEDGELTWVAPRGRPQPDRALRQRLQDELTRCAEDAATVAMSASKTAVSALATQRDSAKDRPYLLALDDGHDLRVVAAASLAVGSAPLRAPSPALLTALAEGLA
jgi:serine/threonine-protein kinase